MKRKRDNFPGRQSVEIWDTGWRPLAVTATKGVGRWAYGRRPKGNAAEGSVHVAGGLQDLAPGHGAPAPEPVGRVKWDRWELDGAGRIGSRSEVSQTVAQGKGD